MQEGEPISELLSSYLLPEQVKVLEQYRMRVEQVWIEMFPYHRVFFPDGSVHRANPSEGPTVWSVILPGGMKVHYYSEGTFYVVLLGNEGAVKRERKEPGK